MTSTEEAEGRRRDPRKTAMRISLLVSVVMLAGKLTAYAITHSAAMLADAAESVVHGVATGFAAFSLWYASRPADEDHRYGHGRVVYFSTGFEGALILAAAITVWWAGVESLLEAPRLERLGIGMSIAAVLAVINLALGLFLVRVGKAHQAVAVEANGHHVLSDFWTTAGALIGVGLVMITGVHWFDTVTAFALGTWIMISGISLLRRSVAGLMDKVEPVLIERLSAGFAASVQSGRIREFHELRCRRVNDEIWVDVHLLIPGEIALNAAHVRVTEVEASICDLFPEHRVRIVSHIEPADHERVHPGGHSLD